ncbi:DNA helicase-2 / ATP-dependent DNA helicase PcrA [Pilibacter termitis]|uniref:DNA helicase-2 / ATP-dependent DNA helicase PcrA n=1 Tax=Pilibacter termitis TaxID=263852 RepID=A0A1T4MIY6_9ENTE|nr:RNA polymerase recycling motor HelD [Pilibacter termitis]SJZ66805.1 DNA helicase-2 / ATP-dependent DNA helicase PcrA [Pilibacter termitis]
MKKDWEYEQTHLIEIYDELEQAEENLTEELHVHHEEGISRMREMDKELPRDLSDLTNRYDKLAEMEIRNQEIDQLNFKHDSLSLRLEQVKRLLKRPYFARVDVDFMDEAEREQLYLGVHSFVNDEQHYRIYDWRSPVAELYYNQELGKTSYTANGREIPVDLKLRRQFQLEGRVLKNYFDSTVAIEDALLLSALEADSSEYMQDITATIQKEQNEIIRELNAQVLLVNGIAGSGKTSAVLQRIAYLLYQERVNLRAEDVVLFSPNPVFMQYISQVLPNLGEKNPTITTLYTFCRQHLNKQYSLEMEEIATEKNMTAKLSEQEKTLQSKEFLEFLLKESEEDMLEEHLFKDVLFRERTLISKKQLFHWYMKTPHTSTVRARLQATALHAEKLLKKRLDEKASTEDLHNRILSLTEEQQEKYFGALIEDTSKKNVTRLAKIFLRKQYKKPLRAIRAIRWFDLTGLLEYSFLRYSGKKLRINSQEISVSQAIPLILLEQLYLESQVNRQVKYVLIDEVQDYSPAQIFLLARLFPRAKFTLLGDENQAIFNTHSSFEELAQIFEQLGKTILQRDLLTSYRSAGAITHLFSKLADRQTKLDIVAIREEGEPVEMVISEGNEEYFTKLEQEIAKWNGRESIAILTKDSLEARELFAKLKDKVNLQLFQSKTQAVPNNQAISILPISLAKGLELDHVIIHNASAKRFVTKRDRHLLYTMVSRAMKSVTVLVNGEVTEFLR